MKTDLSEMAMIADRVRVGHVVARAKGPILVSSSDSVSRAAAPRGGKVLGGAASRKHRDLTIFLKNRFRRVSMSRRIADRIGRRFYSYNRYGVREPLAEAKTDRKIVLKIDPRYRDNFPRYLEVIRRIAVRESDIRRQLRMQRLADELRKPATAREAALQLEAIGRSAIPFLRPALNDELPEVRFHAAMALAYLNDESGVSVLGEAAREERAFRVYALAALAALDHAESLLMLRRLLLPAWHCHNAACANHGQRVEGGCAACGRPGELKQSGELQYGAFRALWTVDRHDSAIRGERLNDEFNLHIVRSAGRPMIHVTQVQRAEIVLFGGDQRLRTPIAVKAGSRTWVTATGGSDTVVVSRYEVGRPDRRRVVSTRIADVIRALSEIGATYPDVAGMLVEADRQRNIPGGIRVDALPRAGRVYFRQDRGTEAASRRSRQAGPAPNLFPSGGPANRRAASTDKRVAESAAGIASLVERRSSGTGSSQPEVDDHRGQPATLVR